MSQALLFPSPSLGRQGVPHRPVVAVGMAYVVGTHQFEGWPFWNTYPTHFIVDIFEALAGAKRDQAKKDSQAQLGAAITDILNKMLDNEVKEVDAQEMWRMLAERGVTVDHGNVGRALSSMGIRKTRSWRGNYIYLLDSVQDATKDPEKFMAEADEEEPEG